MTGTLTLCFLCCAASVACAQAKDTLVKAGVAGAGAPAPGAQVPASEWLTWDAATNTATFKLVAGTLRGAKVGRRWLVILEQGAVWVPRDAFVAWERQEAFAAWGKAPGSCTPVEEVPGAILVADMDLAYRRNVEAFLWRKAKRLAESQATAELEMELADMGENARDGAAAQDAVWMQRATDDNARRAWFESMPLIRALRAPEAPAAKKKHKGGKRKHSVPRD